MHVIFVCTANFFIDFFLITEARRGGGNHDFRFSIFFCRFFFFASPLHSGRSCSSQRSRFLSVTSGKPGKKIAVDKCCFFSFFFFYLGAWASGFLAPLFYRWATVSIAEKKKFRTPGQDEFRDMKTRFERTSF